MDLSGQNLGKYSITKKLGAGGMGNVYLARDTILDRLVALKLLTPAIAADASFVERFQLEARVLARLDHPSIVRVFNADWVDNQLYLAMEYIQGGSLDKALAEQRIRPTEWSLRLLEQVAAGIDYAHQRGLVHRDIKPANILIDTNGQARISDFGLVKDAEISLTADGQRLGTPAYMAPEQIQGRDMGPAVDIYALGVVAYELFAGQPPYRGTISAVFEGHLLREPPLIRQFNPAIPPAVHKVVARAIAKDPAERHPTAAALVAELKTAFEQADAGGETILDGVDAPAPARAAAAPVRPAPASDATYVEPYSPPAAGRSAALPDMSGINIERPARTGFLSGLGFGAGAIIVVAALCLCSAGAYFLYSQGLLFPAATPTQSPTATLPPTETSAPTATNPPAATDAPSPTSPPAATSTPALVVIYEENFNVQPELSFPTDFLAEGSLDYVNGGYQISVDAVDWAFWGLAEGNFDQVSILVDATNVSAVESNVFGIICGYLGPDEFYYAYVGSDGFFGIIHRAGGVSTPLASGAVSQLDLIRPGGEPNRLRLDCYGSELRLWANGFPLAQAPGIVIPAGQVGLIVRSQLQPGVAILFDNFVVAEPIP